jgi:hypothetical protein
MFFELKPSLERLRATPQVHEFLAKLREEWASTT